MTILEPGEPGGEQAASYGNGAWLSTASVVPVSMPGLWRRVPDYLRDPLGPLAIRWSYLPRLLPWLTRFLRAGSTIAESGGDRAGVAPADRRRAGAARASGRRGGRGGADRAQGAALHLSRRAEFEAEALAWRLRGDNGVRWIELDENELRQREPVLDRRYTFGVMVEDGGNCTDPGGYVAALVRHARTRGAVLRRERAVGFRIEATAA